METLNSDLGAFGRAVFSRWFSGMCGVLTVPLTIASPFVNSTAARVLLLATAAICFLVAMFSVWRRERRRATTLEAQVATRGRLEIDFIPGQRRFEESRQGLYREIKRALSVRVKNVGGSPVSACRLYALSVEPNEGNLAEQIRIPREETNLNPGDFFFLPIATYGEPHDTMATLHIPFKPDGSGGERTMGIDLPYTVTLRATGAGSAPCDRRFKVWIADRLLQMEALG